MRRKIYFRADASVQIGYGHFVRTLALAEMMKEYFDCSFFTASPTQNQREQVSQICKLVALPSDDTKFSIFLNYLKGDEIVFLDNYFFTPNYQKCIKEKGCKLVCIGPNDRHYYCDVLINYSERSKEVFSVESYTRVCLGLDWVILRKPFRLHKVPAISRNNRIVLCYGGTDQFHLLEKTVDVIHDISLSQEIIVIASDTIGKERMSFFLSRGVKCVVNASSDEIFNLFCSSMLLICSSSTIAHEGLACGIPVLCGYYVENQINMYKYFVEKEMVVGLSNLLSDNFQQVLSDVLKHIDIHLKTTKAYEYNNVEKQFLTLFKEL